MHGSDDGNGGEIVSARPEFEKLLADLLDAEGKPAPSARLQELMREDESFRKEYVSQMRAHALLRWSSGEAMAETKIVPIFSRKKAVAKWMAAAAALMIGAVAWWSASERPEKELSPNMVRLEVLEATQAADSQSHPVGFVKGMELMTSGLQMPSGLFRFRLGSGVVVGVTGPAELQFVNPMHLRVLRGKVTADVGEHGKGFIVDTEQTRIVDLGTRFGVDVADSGHTDVVVFQGEVELHDTQEKKKNSSVSRLVEGQAVRVNLAKEMSRITSVSSGPEGDDEWSTSGIPDKEAIITAVHDNLHNPQSNFYYRILRGGMKEDARAFIAKRHEWNGLDETGMPEWLIGADLVQTFGADRRNTDLQLTVSTAFPSVVYLFVDSRVPPPEWLKRDFINTGERIGLENAPLAESGIPIKTGPGSGNLAPFAIWKREITQPGEYLLGAPPTAPEDRPQWMYGIAAKRL